MVAPGQLKEHRPIVVLAVEAPPTSLAKSYPDVAFLKGSALRMEDLEACAVRTAAEVRHV